MKFVFLLVILGISYAAEWAYTGDHGVNYWSELEDSNCGNGRQSPIDIPWSLEYQSYVPFTMYGYNNTALSGLTVKNNGHTAQVDIPSAEWGRTYVVGGGLDGKYIAIQFHFHWGRNDGEGSEHTFRGQKYPLELHIVHYKDSYGSLTNALNKSDGLAVLGFFFTTVDAEDNEALAPLIDAIDQLNYKGENRSVNINFDSVLPDATTEFYRYNGSLTTPLCNEVVIWTVFENINTISSAQLAKFRQLYETEESEPMEKIAWNYRPTQSLNGRTVYKNFNSDVPSSWHWGYHAHEGPEYWKNYYQTCMGTKQSPVDIPVVAELAPFDQNLGLHTLTFTNYEQQVSGTILNNGHTIQVNLEDSKFFLEKGGLGGRYVAAQFHFHWGPDNMHGSEHTLEGKKYPMELHIVHYKEEYQSVAGALSESDGLAVVGFFFEVSAVDNNKYKPIVTAVNNVKYQGADATVSGFSLRDITNMDLMVNGSGIHIPYYRYMGSLTTPPCSEIVTWTVMKTPIRISSGQLAAFREVAHISSGTISSEDKIKENYRPVQMLTSRKVYQSYDFSSINKSFSLLPSIISLVAALFLFSLLR